MTEDRPEGLTPEVTLVNRPEGLTLVSGNMELLADFTRMLPRLKPARLRSELLIKAARMKDTGEAPAAVDATAGLGEDSILLAAAGWTVHLCERDPVIAALLEDALRRAADNPDLAEIVSRMQLIKCDSREYLKSGEASPLLVLLDPMFPERQKSGLVKKKLQLLQQLEKPCEDEESLLNAAFAAHPRKIVIKRPAKGPYLGGIKPSYSIEGKIIRYDCLVINEPNIHL